MTPNNPEQSDCCKAPLKDFPNMRDGQTVPVICSKCDKDCSVYVPYESVRRLPEQTEPEPTQELGWEEEFDGMELGDGLCPLCAGLASIGSDISENCQDCKTPTTREELKAFIRKVAQSEYEQGIDTGYITGLEEGEAKACSQARTDALREAIGEEDLRKLQSLRKLCIEDDLLDLQSYGWEERADLISDAWEALKVIESLLTNPKDK